MLCGTATAVLREKLLGWQELEQVTRADSTQVLNASLLSFRSTDTASCGGNH